MTPHSNKKRIVLAGGSGFIGTALAAEFCVRGYEVVVLTRSPRTRTDGVRELAWDGEHVGEWIQCLDEAEAVINLTGKNINCPHTPENLRAIASSRINSVKTLAAALGFVKTPSRVWVQTSAVGFYGDTRDKQCDESAPNGNDALAQVCRDWEAAFDVAKLPKTRKVILRIGFVLGRDGGALPVLSKLTKLFLGGAVGNGQQYISWIHLADLVRMFVTAVEDEKATGIFNAVGPNAVTNAEFMHELRGALHRPWSPPAPVFAVKLGARLMGSEPSLALISQRCEPRRFRETGLKFRFAELAPALRDLCGKV
ncbi:MAG TPA: TIGR01777 family oxidoreductase [Verrucomicrobiae bacterium]|nr:TIGR01777 family oxidoreductase [Verrucomicrobiae bacterium]